MTVRAVVLPATALLVPGAAGTAHVLAAVRDVVLENLARARQQAAATGRWAVLADGPVTRHGARQASLAAAGVADRWVPDLPAGPAGAVVAGVPASVALWAVAAVDAPAPTVVEVAASAGDADVADAVQALAGCDVVVVAAGGPDGPGAPAARVLDRLARDGGWVPRTVDVAARGPHLPAAYAVTTWDDDARGQGPADG